MFAKLKALLRKVAAALVMGFGSPSESYFVTCRPDQCRSYLRHAGYAFD